MERKRRFEDVRRIRRRRGLIGAMEVVEQHRTIVWMRAIVDDFERALTWRFAAQVCDALLRDDDVDATLPSFAVDGV